MGWTDDAANSLSDGLKSAERALSLDEKDPLAYVAAARVHMMQGNHDDSIAAIRTALGSIRVSPSPYHSLGMVLTLSGQLDAAIVALLQSERLSPTDPIHWASTAVTRWPAFLDVTLMKPCIGRARPSETHAQPDIGHTSFWRHRLLILVRLMKHARRLSE